MAILLGTIRWFKRNLFYIGFFLVTLCSVYVLFPKQGTNKLEFQKGNPWRHKSLIAPFDFPVLKTKEIIASERDSIKKDFFPYLILDSKVGDQQLMLFDQELKEAIAAGKFAASNQALEKAAKIIKTIMEGCYAKGIIGNSDRTELQQTGKEKLYFLENNVASMKETNSILTLKSAYMELIAQLTDSDIDITIIQKIQKTINLARFIDPNLMYSADINKKMLDELLAAHSTTRGVVQSGERIISEGDIVNNQNFILLESLQQAYTKNNDYGGWISTMIIGKMLLVLMLMVVLIFYLQIFNRDLPGKKRNFALIFTNILITFLLARLVYNSPSINFYVIPFCILPIIIRTFTGIRLAIFVHMVSILMIGFLAPNSFEFVFIQLIAGTIAVMSVTKLHRRGYLLLTAATVIIAYLVIFMGFELIKEGSFILIDFSQLKWFALSGFLILIAYPLIFLYEKIFGFISDVTLMELSDTNHPLLRRLAEEAPGTFQHSLQVANLAEAVIVHTGGNPMLVRAGALYHDVGKISNAHYYIENQTGGSNPHENLSDFESAAIIIDHVGEGIIMARKYKIPEMIIDFIKMHHGKSLTRYFYLKHRDENPEEEIDVERFMYPGPNPNTRETAVLMLADSVEAATRSLPEKSEENLKRVINQIIDFKVNNHEFDDSPITFNDIKVIKEIFLRKMINIYHIRIQYPVIDYLRK